MNTIIDLMLRNMLDQPAIPEGGECPIADSNGAMTDRLTGESVRGESVREAVVDLLADGWPLAEIRFETFTKAEGDGWKIRLAFIFGFHDRREVVRTGVIADSYESAIGALAGLSVESDEDDMVLKVPELAADTGDE